MKEIESQELEAAEKAIRERRRKFHYYQQRLSETLHEQGSGSRAYDVTLEAMKMHSVVTGEDVDALLSEVERLRADKELLLEAVEPFAGIFIEWMNRAQTEVYFPDWLHQQKQPTYIRQLFDDAWSAHKTLAE